MGRPRASLEDLALQGGGSNLSRALKREKEQIAPALTSEQRTEVAQLDALIQQALKCCRKGQTVDGRPNPAFANLASLVKTRELLLRGRHTPRNKSSEDLLAESKKLLDEAGVTLGKAN